MGWILEPMASFALFERQWATHRAVVAADLLEHRALGAMPYPCRWREGDLLAWIEAIAHANGWRWHWAWQGQHQAEALVVLTPS